MTDNIDWVYKLPNDVLRDIHYALRLSVKHPGLSEDEQQRLTDLADICWNEHARRTEEKYELRKYANG